MEKRAELELNELIIIILCIVLGLVFFLMIIKSFGAANAGIP